MGMTMAKKWDGDVTPSEKLLLLFTILLFNRRAFSLSELSSPAYLNASKPTVSRLLRQLEHSGAGILIQEKRGRESYFRLEHKQAPGLAVDTEGIAMLALCRDLAFPLLPEHIRTETAHTLALLGGRSAEAQTLDAASLVKGRVDYAPFQKIFSIIEGAIRKKVVCSISYLASSNAEARQHLFAPLRLLCSQESIYIEGWLLEQGNPCKRKYDDPLRLALQRFQACEQTEISSAQLPSLPQISNETLGLMDYDPFTARIWFAPEAANYIAERSWSKGQTLERGEDGSVVLTVRMANYAEALSWVLGFGKKAVVMEPAWFAREVRGELRAAARNYKKKIAEGLNGESGEQDRGEE